MQNFWRVEKILSLKQAAQLAAELKAQGKNLVTVNGSFDVLHGGHIRLLEEAKQQGDILIVGLNSDATIRQGKGDKFPVLSEDQRAAVLAALICVDYVIPIDGVYNTTHDILLEMVKPAVHASSGERGPLESWEEYPMMKKYGITGYVVTHTTGISDEEITSHLS